MARKTSRHKPAKALPATQLRRVCAPKSLGFRSTRELDPIDTLVGQDRALGAIRFGAGIDRPGYNMFVLGPQGTGRHTAVLSYLKTKAALEATPDDWVYVHNFEDAHRPRALRLPNGTAIAFRDAMGELVSDLQAAIPAQFQSDEYREKRQAIDAQFEEAQEAAFEDLRRKAEAQSVGILRTPMGFALAPMQDGQVIKPDVFNELPEDQRREIEEKIGVLQKELATILERMPQLEKRHRDSIRALNGEIIGVTVEASIKAVADRFAKVTAILERLEDIRKDLTRNAELFLPQAEAEAGGDAMQRALAGQRFNRYLVNVVVADGSEGGSKGAPIVSEDYPTMPNLIGRIEQKAQFGALVTDFTMIRPGALHNANGGYLVLDARKVLTEPFAWDALKRALHGNCVSIVPAGGQFSLVSTTSLEPEPIPLDVKVVLIGERMLYYMLSSADPEFGELFKVEADFNEELPRDEENLALYSRLIATVAEKDKLRPLDAGAVARVIDEAVRMAEDAERLSLRVGLLADLMREADYWAGQANRRRIIARDVERARAEQIARADRVRNLSHETIEREIVRVDTDGEQVGQVNGLSVLSVGRFAFGKPARITARVRMGTGRVIDIERETKLGGPLHSKGVLILSSYLAANFARDVPMSLWASVVFEQSYGGVDGDSASSAELYALLSALAGVPVSQALAVTGSVDQNGQVQAIGGVNQKIEGFFDICSARGLTGRQGVLIPASNVQHLMVRPDVVAACRKGRFRIHAVSDIAQGVEIMTGMPAGVRDDQGHYPEGSIFGRVEARLRGFAEIRRRFASDDAEPAGREASA